MIAHMDALFSKNVEDKEVYVKKNLNVEGVVEGVKNADSSSAEKISAASENANPTK